MIISIKKKSLKQRLQSLCYSGFLTHAIFCIRMYPCHRKQGKSDQGSSPSKTCPQKYMGSNLMTVRRSTWFSRTSCARNAFVCLNQTWSLGLLLLTFLLHGVYKSWLQCVKTKHLKSSHPSSCLSSKHLTVMHILTVMLNQFPKYAKQCRAEMGRQFGPGQTARCSKVDKPAQVSAARAAAALDRPHQQRWQQITPPNHPAFRHCYYT